MSKISESILYRPNMSYLFLLRSDINHHFWRSYVQPSVSDITGGRIDLKFLAPGSTGLYYILITKKVSSDNARGNTNELLMVSILHKSSKNKGKSSTINNATYIIGIASFCSIILD